MEKKYLLGMLFGGAMLASCSTDDFDSVKVAKDVNPSAPVFTVSFDGDKTRAGILPSGHVGFEPGDLLSLYHGVSAESNDNFASFTKYGNAIYEGSSNGESFDYTTKALVNEGGAVMVYPADTAFVNVGTDAPVIEIDHVQNAKTKTLTPYMSEILTIGEYNKEAIKDVAGYDKKYDISMKRVGTTLDLKLNIDGIDELDLPSDVPGINVTKVELKDATTGAKPFTTSIPVKALSSKPYSYKENEAHVTWLNQSDLDQANADGVASITTTDINNNVATFTLLPSKVENNNTPTFTKGQVIVHTTYGKVTLEDPATLTDADKIWIKSGTPMGIKAGLENLLSNDALWTAATKEGTFKGENVGGAISRTLNVKITKLNMNGLHIQNETDLLAALAVYNVTAAKDETVKEVNFILDGYKENDNKFIMHKDTWVEVAKQLATEGNKVSLSLCGIEGEECKGIRLVNDGAAEEVPALQFVTLDEEEAVDEETPADVTVELVGNWKYSSVKNNPKVAEEGKEEWKNLSGIAKIIVKDYIELQNYISATTDAEAFEIEIKQGAKAEVSGIVNLQVNMTNHGRIKIPEGGDQRLAVNSGAVLINREAQGEKATGWWTVNEETGVEEAGGVIDNFNVLAIVNGSDGEIHNYGTINIHNETASTLITSNADKDATITAGFTNEEQAKAGMNEGTTNRIGTINLLHKDAGVNKLTISSNKATTDAPDTNAGKTGFIKIKKSLSSTATVANYIVLDGNVDSYTNTASVKYVQVESSKQVVFETGTTNTLNGLIIPQGKSIYVNEGKTVALDGTEGHVFVKGTITFAGTFTYNENQLEGYFGGNKKTDVENLYSWK